MAEAFSSLLALVSGDTKNDVPVPACLNHCINQEVFNCKICGEVFDNIHKYITHGKGHRGSSCVCGFCGGVWPNYSALCIHQLVWESKDTKTENQAPGEKGEVGSKVEGRRSCCPLSCGMDPLPPNLLRSHLISFHGAQPDKICTKEKDGETIVNVDLSGQVLTCPKCQTTISKEKVGLEKHLGLECLKRSPAVQQRVQELRDQAARDGEEPILVLLQEIQALILHLKDLLEKGEYRDKFLEEGLMADKKYNRLPKSFCQDYLAWVPVGYTLQVLETEGDNFPVIFDVWSQVVDRLAGPDSLQDLSLRLESELSRNLSSGLVPRWPSLSFDPAMLDTPDQDILAGLERQLGWVK